MSRFPIFLVALLLLQSIPWMAHAQTDGAYLGGAAGVSLPLDSETNDGTAQRDVGLDIGYGLSGAVGYGFGNGFRMELELGFFSNDVDSVTGAANASGDVDTLKLMGNVLYDFRNTGLPITPYLGLGLGGARVSADGIDPFSNTRIDDSDTAFAYQAIAGASYKLNDRVDLTLDYRFLNVPDVDLRTDAGTGVDAEYATHAVMFGLRYSFAAPKKAVAPAPTPIPETAPKIEWKPTPEPAKKPAPQAPRNYIVFFDWDRSDLRIDAREIIQTAAGNLNSAGGVVRIVLTGHADRSGPDRYNLGLSQRRADAVRAELRRLGIQDREIVTIAKGEREPLVATDDGVREPRNRRVEIVFE